MPDYQQAKIYRIINDSIPDKVYYGSTCQKLSMRMSSHRAQSRKKYGSSKQLFENGKALIVLVENYPCNSKEELLKRERYYIENNDCVNKQIPGRTQEEYYQKNKERILLDYSKPVTCECGRIVPKNHLTRHKKSARHLKLVSVAQT